jgi:hypothetical protein
MPFYFIQLTGNLSYPPAQPLGFGAVILPYEFSCYFRRTSYIKEGLETQEAFLTGYEGECMLSLCSCGFTRVDRTLP